MLQGPVAVAAVDRIGGFDNRCQTDLQPCRGGHRRQVGRGNAGLDFQAAGKQPGDDLRRREGDDRWLSLAVGGESIAGPLSGRREVELAVSRIAGDADEGLEAGVLP